MNTEMKTRTKMLRCLVIISSVVLSIWIGSSSKAQVKTTECEKIKFSMSVLFTDCFSESILGGVSQGNSSRIIFTELDVGIFHDQTSSVLVLVYSNKLGITRMSDLGSRADPPPKAMKKFFVKLPDPNMVNKRGDFRTYLATVNNIAIPTQMNCTEFVTKSSLLPSGGPLWIAIVTMCLATGEVSDEVSDLLIKSLKVNIGVAPK